MSEIEETAKATQEIAKTASKALDKADKAGTFIAKYIDAPLVQAVGIFEDKLKYRRWENQLTLMKKADDKIKELGYINPPRELSLKLGLPLIEAASLEDDDKLQDLWANLLVNGTTNFSLERSYISVLEQLSPVEAQILIKIYNHIGNNIENVGSIDVTTYPNVKISKKKSEYYTGEEQLVEEVKIEEDGELDDEIDIDTVEFNLALSNLIRLNCLRRVITFGGGENFRSVHPTIFGAKLYEAVKDPIK